MPRTIQCNKCGVILNLPDRTKAGKRLKCPRCAFKFVVTEAEASSVSTVPGLTDAAPASTHELPKRPPSQDDLPTTFVEGDLRETFDLPLISGREAERGAAVPQPTIGDAASLFDDRGAPKRKTTAADARAKARRCSSCGGIVPQGMSICISCGLDQETGIRAGLDDEDLLPAGPAPSQGPPIHVAVVGGLCVAVGLILVLLAVTRSVRGNSDWRQYGWLFLACVSAYGIYSAVEFIRGRTAKLLMVSLMLGIIVDLMALVALPIFEVILDDPQHIISTETKPDLDDSNVQIKPPEQRMDTRRISYGIGVIVSFAILYLYLMSPPVKKYIHSRAARAYDPQDPISL
jgi:phage FluMu protein Com